MSIRDCLDTAIGIIEKSDIFDDTMRDEVVGSLRRYNARADLPDDQAYQKMLLAMAHAKRELYVAAITKAASLRKTVELTDNIFGKLEGLQHSRALRDYVDPEAGERSRAGVSPTEVKIRAEQSMAVGRLNEVWSRIIGPTGADTAFALDFRRAQLGLPASKGAQAAAKQFREVTRGLLERMRAGGAYVGDVDNWTPRAWHLGKIKSNLDDFTTRMREALDPQQHPDPDSTIDRMLYHLHHSDLGDPTQDVISVARQLKFTSPEAELELVARYTADNFAVGLQDHVAQLAKRTVLVEEYGPNPRAAMQPIIDQSYAEVARLRMAGSPDAHAAEVAVRRAERSLSMQLGELGRPESQTLANWAGAARNWVTGTRLGKVPIAMLSDGINTVVRSRFHGSGFGTTTANLIYNIVQLAGRGPALQMAKDIGLWQHSFQMASAGRFTHTFASGQLAHSRGARFAAVTQKVSLAHTVENALRASMGRMILTKLGRALGTDWDGLNPRYRLLLESSGITSGMWRRMQAGGRVNELGILDPSLMKGAEREAVMTFLWRELDIGVVHPGSYDRWILAGGSRAGTVPGELLAASTQFLSWPIAMFRKMVISEWQLGRPGFVGFAAASVASGVLISQLYEAASGRPMFEWDSPTLWMRGIFRSGLLSPLGEFVISAVDGQPSMELGGASLGMGIDVLLGGYNAALAVADDDLDAAGAELVRRLKPNLVPNLWWLEPFMAEVMDRAMEELDPQYLRRRNSRWRQEGRDL